MSTKAFKGTDRFELRGLLGEGGMGAVYEAYDRHRDVTVALKTLHNVDAAGIYRLKKEFRAVVELSHPNLVNIHELVNDGDMWFFTMDMVKGVDFTCWVRGPRMQQPTRLTVTGAGLDWLNDDPEPSAPARPTAAASFDEERLRDSLAQLARCIRSVHGSGKLHRDLKPSNVLVAADGRVSVLDFGLARASGTEAAYASLESVIVGTPAYMAPEQASGQAVSPATDWYSIGVMLYEALTGLVPFGGSVVQLLTSKQVAEPPHPVEMVSGLPDDLATLAADLLRRDPAARPSGDEVLRRLSAREDAVEVIDAPPSSRRELLGRSTELDALRQALTAARTSPQVVRIQGSPGVGKTMLLRRFLATLPDDAVVLAGRCREHESVPYKALDAVVDNLARYLQHLPMERARALLPRGVRSLARIFPVLHRVEAIASISEDLFDAPDLLVFRRRAFNALRQVFAAIGRHASFVLLVDDAHWGDGDSAALLEELLRPPGAPRMLLVLAHRAGTDESPLLKPFTKQGDVPMQSVDVRVVDVLALGYDDATRLARVMLSGRPNSAAQLAQSIAGEARGNPQLIAELSRHALLHGDDAAPRLEDIFSARIEGLPDDQRAVVEVLAVAGALPVEVVAEAAGIGVGGARVVAALGAAKAVRSVPAGDRALLDLYHERVRAAVLAGLNMQGLRGLHRRVVDALGDDADAERIAYHLEHSGDREGAAQRLMGIAVAAGEGLAFDRAATLFQRALELLAADAPRRAWLLELLGDALASGGRSAEAAAAYLTASNTPPPVHPDEARPRRTAIELQRVAAEHLLRSGRIDEGLAHMREVLDKLGVRMPESPRGALVSTLYHRARLRLRGLEARHDAPAPDEQQQRMIMDACWSMAVGQSMVDTIAGADFHARHLLFALDAGDQARLARALALEGAHIAASGSDGHERALELFDRSEQLGYELGDPHAFGLSKLMRGGHALFVARWSEAVKLTDEAVAIFRNHCINVAWEIATASRFNLVALYYMGKLGEMSRRLPGDLAEARARGDRFAESCIRSGSSVVAWLAQGEIGVAERQLAEEVGRWGDERFALQHYLTLQGLTYVDLYAGRGEVAAERLERHWTRLEGSMLMRVQLLRATMLGLRARTALATGRPRHAERDAGRLEKEGLSSSNALAKLLRAMARLHREDHDGATKGLRAAVTDLDGLGMRLLAAAARARLADVVGGDESVTLRQQVHDYMSREKVVDADALVRMLAP